MQHTVRATLRAGADWIKLATTGGLVSEHDEPLIPELTPEEIAVAVFEAGRKGKHVSAHAYGGEGLTNAVEAGTGLGLARGDGILQRHSAEVDSGSAVVRGTTPRLSVAAAGAHGAPPPARTPLKPA